MGGGRRRLPLSLASKRQRPLPIPGHGGPRAGPRPRPLAYKKGQGGSAGAQAARAWVGWLAGSWALRFSGRGRRPELSRGYEEPPLSAALCAAGGPEINYLAPRGLSARPVPWGPLRAALGAPPLFPAPPAWHASKRGVAKRRGPGNRAQLEFYLPSPGPHKRGQGPPGRSPHKRCVRPTRSPPQPQPAPEEPGSGAWRPNPPRRGGRSGSAGPRSRQGCEFGQPVQGRCWYPRDPVEAARNLTKRGRDPSERVPKPLWRQLSFRRSPRPTSLTSPKVEGPVGFIGTGKRMKAGAQLLQGAARRPLGATRAAVQGGGGPGPVMPSKAASLTPRNSARSLRSPIEPPGGARASLHNPVGLSTGRAGGRAAWRPFAG